MNTSVQTIRSTLKAFTPISRAQQEVKAVLELFIPIEAQPPDDHCIESLRQDLGAELLYSNKCIKGATTVFRILRDYLLLKGLRYVPNPENQRIIYGFYKSIYESETDKEFAKRQLRNIRAPVEATSSDFSSVTVTRENDDRRIAHNIARRFKKEDKFSGKM